MSVSRVFIANRGEIAVRIVRACRKLGLECVVGASTVDMDGLAAELADRVVCIGPGPAARATCAETVVAAALATGCDALHPGYGFLSENPLLARQRTSTASRSSGRRRRRSSWRATSCALARRRSRRGWRSCRAASWRSSPTRAGSPTSRAIRCC